MLLRVKDLLKILRKEDKNAIVVLSCDAEGNCFSPLDCSYATSTKKDDGNMDIYYNEEFQALPDDTQLLILYPQD